MAHPEGSPCDQKQCFYLQATLDQERAEEDSRRVEGAAPPPGWHPSFHLSVSLILLIKQCWREKGQGAKEE